MGAIFIWLSGASRTVLAECPTERPKYFGLGAVIFVTGAMAGVSLAFALVNALKIALSGAVIFAVCWALAIMMIDRMFVVSMHRQRNPLIYIVQALPRLLMSVVLGFVISTPFVLQIFKPEITNEIQQMQAAQREAYFKGLPANPVYLTVQSDQAQVNSLAEEAASGGPGIDISADSQLQNLESQLAHAKDEVAYWTNELNCQLYGGTTGGINCKPGYGPVGHNDQEELTTWQGQVTTLNGEIATRTAFLQTQSENEQKSVEKTAKAQLASAEQALKAAQNQLTLQTQNVTSGIKQDDGILAQLKALGAVTAGNFTLQIARLMLFLLFLFVDIMPVFIKLLFNLAPASNYDRILADEEEMQLRMAEDDRAVWQAAHRQASQAEAAGVRHRNDALSVPLEGMRQAILDSRMRVEKEWLRRREAEQMRDVASGRGISGIGSVPHADGRHPARPQGQTGGFRGGGPWNGNAYPSGQPRSQGSSMPSAGPAASAWPSSPSRRPDLPQRPAGSRTWVDSLRAWLGSLRLPRLPRLGQQRPPQEQVPQPVPQRQPTGWERTEPTRQGGPIHPEPQFHFGTTPADQDGGPARPEPQFHFGTTPADQDGGPARPGPLADFVPPSAGPDGYGTGRDGP